MLCILSQCIGTKGPCASLKQKLIKNGLFLQSIGQDRSEMTQISHTRHVNVQEHRCVNSLAAQASLQRTGCVLMVRNGEHGCISTSMLSFNIPDSTAAMLL